jgi:hypothetical protein
MAETDLKGFVHERFNRVDQKLDKLLEVLVNVRDRVGILEQQYASISRRLDHVDDRLERIERRIELVPADI